MSDPAFIPLPAWLADSAWAAALHVLTSERFAADLRVWDHVDLEQGLIDFDAICAQPWSGGEARLLGATASLFAGGPVDLGELVCGIDEVAWRLLCGAIALRRAGVGPSPWPLPPATEL